MAQYITIELLSEIKSKEQRLPEASHPIYG